MGRAFVLISGLCLVGCFADPSSIAEVSPCPGVQWLPNPCDDLHNTPIMPCEEELLQEWFQHEGKWSAIDLIDIALRKNPLTHRSWQRARAAAFRWRASQSDLYPTVIANEELLIQKNVGGGGGGSFDISDGEENVEIPVEVGEGSPDTSSYNQWLISSLSFSYLMLDFGGRSANIEATRQALLSLNWSHNRNIQTIILSVLTNYYEHLQAKALFKAREEDLRNSEETFRAAEGRFESGVGGKLDTLLARSNLSNIRLLLEQQRGLVKITLGRLATSVGMPANTVFTVNELPEDLKLEKICDGVEGLIALAKLERPDLAAAEANWKEAQANATVIWSEGMPTLTASGLIQSSTNLHDSNLNSQLYNGSIMLNIPIFNGFFYVNQTRNALALASEAFALWRNQEDIAVLDVVVSYYNFITAIETVKNSNEYYSYTKEAYEIALASYKAGVGTLLDLLAAQAALANARAQRIEARTHWLTSLTDVSYATGQL